jgi:hypothetical protein
MCVAIIVESDITPDTLTSCDDANPHGIGVAWAQRDRIAYRKGLSLREVIKIAPRLPRPFLLHFRWATHGPRVPHLTHPFPLGERALISRATEGTADAVLIHNGVWSDYRRWVPAWVDAERWSDTAVAAYVAGTVGEEVLDHVAWSTATARAAGGGRIDITLRGRWMSHTDGNTYSNLHWLPRSLPTPRAWAPHAAERTAPLGFVMEPRKPASDPYAAYMEPHRSVMRALSEPATVIARRK